MLLYQHIKKNQEIIINAKKIVENFDNDYITHIKVNEKELNNETISIVMTTYNRPIQTFFTLKKISESKYKNIQVIIIDDYQVDQYNVDDFKKYDFQIDYVRIKNKFWVNPCVNYNIGFKLIKGGKIIIQNAEVCHIGDVINYLNDNLKDNQYFVFDVHAMASMQSNEILYDGNLTYEKMPEILNNGCGWLQHIRYSNRNFHFLTGITSKTFEKIKGFDYDFCAGTSWDDNELVFRILQSDIKIINVNNETEKIMGIHQWHYQTPSGYHSSGKFDNAPLFNLKCDYFFKHNKFLDLINEKEYVDKIIQ